MKYFTTAQWAQIRDMSMGDIEECLMELGYQTLDTTEQLRWRLTPKGQTHGKKSWNLWDHTLRWDFDAFFDAVKYYGRKTGRYFYCPKCGDYLNNQHCFDVNMDKWECKQCGLVIDLVNEVKCANLLAQEHKSVIRSSGPETQKKEVLDVQWKCSKCGRIAYSFDEISAMFGFVKTAEGKLNAQSECKKCRGRY